MIIQLQNVTQRNRFANEVPGINYWREEMFNSEPLFGLSKGVVDGCLKFDG